MHLQRSANKNENLNHLNMICPKKKKKEKKNHNTNFTQKTHLRVNYNVVEPSSCNDLQSCCIGHVTDCDQVSQQPLHFAAVESSLWVPVRQQKRKNVLNMSIKLFFFVPSLSLNGVSTGSINRNI